MQNCQVQCFRPPIPVRGSSATGVGKRAVRLALIFLIVFHVSLPGSFNGEHFCLDSLRGSVPGLLHVWYGRLLMEETEHASSDRCCDQLT